MRDKDGFGLDQESMVISQREAKRLQKRVAELELRERDRNNKWASEYPGGVNIDTIDVKSEEWYIVRTARLLGHAVVVLPVESQVGKLRVYGIKTT